MLNRSSAKTLGTNLDESYRSHDSSANTRSRGLTGIELEYWAALALRGDYRPVALPTGLTLAWVFDGLDLVTTHWAPLTDGNQFRTILEETNATLTVHRTWSASLPHARAEGNNPVEALLRAVVIEAFGEEPRR